MDQLYIRRGIAIPETNRAAFEILVHRYVKPSDVIHVTFVSPEPVDLGEPVFLAVPPEFAYEVGEKVIENVPEGFRVSRDIIVTSGVGRVSYVTMTTPLLGEDELTFIGLLLDADGNPITSAGLLVIFDPEHLPARFFGGIAPQSWVGKKMEDLHELYCYSENDETVEKGAWEMYVTPSGILDDYIHDVQMMFEVFKMEFPDIKPNSMVIAWTYK